MSIAVHTDLHHPEDMEAFAAFLIAAAASQRKRYESSPKDNFGGISTTDPMWRTAGGEAHTTDEAKAWSEVVAFETLDTTILGSTTVIPTRTPGQPSPGAKRRTKAEIAEDDAAAVERVKSGKADVLAGAAAAQAAYDSPEDAAQDAADEAAEAAAGKTGLTHDDLRQAVGRYQKKFGMAAAVAGVPALLGCALIDVPEADLAVAIAKVDAAVATADGGATPEVVTPGPAATKDDLIAAMKRYALKYDGQDQDMNAMPHTMVDCPAIFKLLFGAGVDKLSQVPADGYLKAIAGIDEAIAKDPFKRGAK